MEDPLISNQISLSSSAAVKQPKSSKWLYILLSLIILVLVGEGIYWLKLREEEPPFSSQTQEPQEEEEAFLPGSPSPHPIISYALPVGKESFEGKRVIKFDSNADDWAFFLPEGEPVYAAFSGRVEWAGENEPQKIIRLISDEEKLVWKYIFTGEVLVENGRQVEEGAVIAKVGATPLPTYDFNLVVQALWGNQRVSLDL